MLDVLYYFQTFASLEGFGILRDRQMLLNLNARTVEVWECAGPYVLAERARSRGAESSMLTVLVMYVHKLSEELSEGRAN